MPEAQRSGVIAAMALQDEVRDALQHLHEPTHLERHPLTARLGALERAGGAGRSLRADVVQAVEALRPAAGAPAQGHASRGYRILRRQYVDGVPPSEVQRELAVSKSEYFRDQRRAVEAVCALLEAEWERQAARAIFPPLHRADAATGRSGTASAVKIPETRYARSGDVNIAYQVVGSGPPDFVFVMGWASNIELFWREPAFARFLQRLASFSRLILFDKRGTGLSDRVSESELPSLEQRMDDVRAVLDAVGSQRAALMGCPRAARWPLSSRQPTPTERRR